MAYFRIGANDYSSLQYNNLTADNVKKGVTVTVKDANNQTLKSVTGDYLTPISIPYLYAKGSKVGGDNEYYKVNLDFRISCSGYNKLTIGKLYLPSEAIYGSSCIVYKDSTAIKSYSQGTYTNQNIDITGVTTLKIVIEGTYYSSTGADTYLQSVTLSKE